LADDTQLIGDESIDAVVIATPVNTHYRLAEAALKAGKHVMLEKPMCASAAECGQLIELATKSQLTLMVEFTAPSESSLPKFEGNFR